MKENRHLALSKISSSTQLLIWITEENISKDDPNFELVNYLCDGNVTTIAQEKNTQDLPLTMFWTKSFGKDLLCAHIKKGSEDSLKMACNLIKQLEEDKKIEAKILASNHSHSLKEKLEKSFSNFEFEII